VPAPRRLAVCEICGLTFERGREVLTAIPSPAREMALLSMTASLNVAEMLGLRWKRVNLTGELVTVGGEMLEPFTLSVRENYCSGKFGSVKAKSRCRDVPLSSSMVDAVVGKQRASKYPMIWYFRLARELPRTKRI
jgi:hypothetical protein